MTHDQIIVSLPYPVKVLGITFFLKRKIGFNFTNRLMYRFRDIHNIQMGSDFDKVVKENGGHAWLVNESLYCAALAYIEVKNKKQHFTRDGLLLALNNCDKSIQTYVLDSWKASLTFGLSSKKKTATVKSQM